MLPRSSEINNEHRSSLDSTTLSSVCKISAGSTASEKSAVAVNVSSRKPGSDATSGEAEGESETAAGFSRKIYNR
jgi:hypothetical protein